MPPFHHSYKVNYFLRHMLVTNDSLLALLEIEAKWLHRLQFVPTVFYIATSSKIGLGNGSQSLECSHMPWATMSKQFWTRSSQAFCTSVFKVLLLKLHPSSHLQLYVQNHIQDK